MLFQQHSDNVNYAPFPDEFLWSLSSQAIFSSFSVYLAQVTGWTEQDWLGKPLQDFIHPYDLTLIKDRYGDVLRGQTVRFEKIRCLGRGGDSPFWELSFIPSVESDAVTKVLVLGHPVEGLDTSSPFKKVADRFLTIPCP